MIAMGVRFLNRQRLR